MDLKLPLILGLFAVVFALLIWGRYRYDLIGFGALCVALVFGLVPREEAFTGFSHEATIFVALVLVISQGLVRSGAVDSLTSLIVKPGRSISSHLGIMGGLAVSLSGFMNNVAALAILMPIDLQAAKQAKRAASRTLMPLSFATLLGGLITLIGTPPNIIISAARENALGEPFEMFDFAPVGIACAVAGLFFIATIGWRLLPDAHHEAPADTKPIDDDLNEEAREVLDYIAELLVCKTSPLVGMSTKDFKKKLGNDSGLFLALVKKDEGEEKSIKSDIFEGGDVIVVEGGPQHVNRIRRTYGLEFIGEQRHKDLEGGELSFSEVVVTRESRLVGRTPAAIRYLRRQGISVAGVSRQGRPFAKSVADLKIQTGDVLMLVGAQSRLADAIDWLDCLPLARRDLIIDTSNQAGLAITVFAGAILLASFGVISIAAALASVVAIFALTEIMPLRELYRSVAWPVVILLGSIIPLAGALEDAGGTRLIAEMLVNLTAALPTFAVLIILMVLVMIMADIMNTVATAVIAAPIALDVAARLQVSPDPFLMAVAIASSCAMLTPIGHKNNTIIMGPGGYRFTDYWRLGLPVQSIVIAVAVPMVMIVWPF